MVLVPRHDGGDGDVVVVVVVVVVVGGGGVGGGGAAAAHSSSGEKQPKTNSAARVGVAWRKNLRCSKMRRVASGERHLELVIHHVERCESEQQKI
eukprot:SAG31_NODE_8602_length_1422_cov_1.327286_1_plen_95_part_00